MCRHLAYLGPSRTLAELLTEPSHSLYEQSWAPRRQRHGTVNADGFGIGWYPDGAPGPCAEPPARYRRAVPIWADANLPDLARVITSSAVLAAVRDATEGTSRDESALAPYRDGPWLFSHNGAVPSWTRLPATALAPLTPAELLDLDARCDTAVLWALLRHRLRRGEQPGDALAAVVRQTEVARPTARLNLLLTDGHTLAATRHGDSLWHRSVPGEVRVASEPDTADGWQELPEHSLLLAGRHSTDVVPLAHTRPDPPAAERTRPL